MRLVSLPRLVPRDILLSRNALWENCMTTQISLRVKPNWHSFRPLGCHINWWVDGILQRTWYCFERVKLT